MAFQALFKWIKVIARHSRNEQILNHLAMAAKQTDEGIVVFELNGTIRFVNTACAKMHGYDKTETCYRSNRNVLYRWCSLI